MSPSTKEVVTNRALSGNELKEIIRQKLDVLMDNEGLLSHYAAYGRIAFTLRLQLHLDNMMQRESEIEGSSSPAGVNVPELSALEAPPLIDPSADAILSGSELDYRINSPNAERLRAELPVPVTVKQQDGTTTQETVKYPKEKSLGKGDQTIKDVTPQVRANWKK